MATIHFLKRCFDFTTDCTRVHRTECGLITTFDPDDRDWDLIVTHNWDNVTCKKCIDIYIRETMTGSYRKQEDKNAHIQNFL